jgi:hypothetical protein
MNRKSHILAAAAVMAVFTLCSRAADEELPKAESIMDRYVEVTGGKALYEKRHSEEMIIEMEFVGKGIKGTLTRYSDSSNNAYSTGQIEGVGKLEEGVYNGQAWENSAMMGPRLKSGAENADAVRESMFNSSLNWRKLYKAEVVGLEKANGEDCYKVILNPIGEGKPQTMYMSKKTGYMVKTQRTAISAMGEIAIEATASDYKPFGGILYPAKITQTVMGNEISLTMVSLKANEEIPKERFQPPAEIRKLMVK